MSTPLQAVGDTRYTQPDWPRMLVNNAVAAFARRHLPDHDVVLERLEKPRLDSALGLGQLTWVETLQRLERSPPLCSTPLQRLVRDFELKIADLFLLALCGEVEQSHELNMVLAALQAPDEGSRPTLHLVSALLNEQFGVQLPPGCLQQHLLVRTGVLTCEGDQPMPLRTLRTSPDLWSLLNTDASYWPGAVAIPEPEPDLLNDQILHLIDKVAAQLGATHARGVLIRGDAENGRLCIAQLAQRLGLTAVRFELQDWQASAMPAAACRYARWLPMVEQPLSPGQELELPLYPMFPMPIALLTGNDGSLGNRDFVQLQLPTPPAEQRRALWQQLLGEDPAADTLADGALLDRQRIGEIARQVNENVWPKGISPGQRVARVRAHLGTHKLHTLAQPVERFVDADALILSPSQTVRFDALLQRCVQRERLWEHLGPTLGNTRNTGVRALFSGESGTGKTLAASHLASRLHAPLFRLDMASVLNKYIGETEKNLSAMLDEAAATDVILLLDEADTLFGKRGDGDSGGERFANMLTNFLLTRIENHPGIVILTSNSQSRIDDAFTRRFDAVLEFALPGYEERLRLWQSHLGARSPGDETCSLLATHCDLPGGYIRNAVLNAAALQPLRDGEVLEVRIIVATLHEEYRKLGRALPPALEQLKGTLHG